MKRDQLCILSFILAFVGLLYEFVFAQTLTIVFGNTHMQYSLTIGIFTFGLGLGSLIFEYFKNKIKNFAKMFAQIQAMLIPVCILGLAAILYAELLFGRSPLVYLVCYLPIFLVALLTGFELPLIMEMTSDPATSIEILSYDFAGMFLATVMFPFFLLPELGVFATLNLGLSLNLASMLYVSKNKTTSQKAYATVIGGFIVLVFIFNANLIEYFGKILTE